MSLNLFVGPDSHPDKYRLVRSVGRGGEATLYLAEVSLAGQTEPVVVKVLNSDVTSNEEQFAELSAKWGEQAELLRFINRLGVVGVREHFEGAPEHPVDGAGEYTDRALYLVMNYVQGVDLRDWRAEHAVEGPRGQREVLRYLEQVALVLDVLHSGRATPSKRVVVHGDLSPGNIMISDEGQATLVDFGLSRIAARHMTARPWFTPGYAAPEIFNGEYSAATDRYAFGAITFFALTGEDPPPAPEQMRERFGALPLVAAGGERQRELVMSMFSAEPGDRPESSDWIRALRSLATSAPWTGPVAEPGDAVLASAMSEAPAPAAPAEPEQPASSSGRSSSAAAEAKDARPQGVRFSGPPPVNGPDEGAPQDAPRNGTNAGGDWEAQAEAVPQRPVGGMRGRPQPHQAAEPTPPTSGPRGVGPAGPPRPPGPTSGPRTSGPQQPQPGPPSPLPPALSVPVHHAPAPTGPQRPVWSGPVPPHTTAAFSHPATMPAHVEAPPKRKSRKPLLIGFAIFGVLGVLAGVGLTYVVMDRVIPTFTVADDSGEAADTAADEPADTPTEPADTPAEDPEAEPEDSSQQESGEAGGSASPEPDGSAGQEGDTTLLTQVDPVDQGGGRWVHTVGRAEIDAEVYSRALVSTESCQGEYNTCTGWGEYNLSRSYETFTAIVGVDDTSSSSGTVTFTVYADGESLVSESVRLGETITIEADVADALRLRLEVEASDPGMYPVWADPTLNV